MVTKSINGTVLACLALFAYIYGTVVTSVIVPWLSFSVPGVLNLGIFTIDTFLALYCFLQSTFTDPGRVPEDYIPEENKQEVVEVKRKDGAFRYCQKCRRHKPPRTHHCKICQRCVLRMCHHCPWINNCVGHGNYKCFLLFLLYVTAALVHAFGLFVAHTYNTLTLYAEKRSHSVKGGLGTSLGSWESILWAASETLCMAVTLPVTIGVSLLLAWNSYLVYFNKTTIEHYEGVTARVLASQSGKAWSHPYDLGPCTNLALICGQKPQYWPFPTRPSASGNGISHPNAWEQTSVDKDFSL